MANGGAAASASGFVQRRWLQVVLDAARFRVADARERTRETARQGRSARAATLTRVMDAPAHVGDDGRVASHGVTL
jgi:hypothetical protein